MHLLSPVSLTHERPAAGWRQCIWPRFEPGRVVVPVVAGEAWGYGRDFSEFIPVEGAGEFMGGALELLSRRRYDGLEGVVDLEARRG